MILGTNRSVRVWAYARPADLRKGYNGLYGLVKNDLGRDPLSGELYLFIDRRRDSCKILAWEGTGLCIFMKRLERGRFAPLWRDGGEADARRARALRRGCTFVRRQPLSPEEVTPAPASASASRRAG